MSYASVPKVRKAAASILSRTVASGAILSLLGLCACGGGGSKLHPAADAEAPLSSWFPSGPNNSAKQNALPPQPASGSLPDLGSLDGLGAARGASVAGPGWLALTPGVFISADGETVNPDGSLSLGSGADPAFVIYGAYNFDGDCFPTSLKLSLSGGTSSGEFYVGFSDYTAGSWVFSGPFNADVTAEIPNVTPYSDPSAYVSPGNTHYVCILAPSPSTLSIAGAELGLDGGDNPPLPPDEAGVGGGSGGAVIFLQPSPSASSPDFSGYLLERAPLLSGNFAAVNAEPTSELSIYDATAVAGTNYRWRVRSIDASGQKSLWLSFSGGPNIGNTPPVPKLKLPYGKLFGPVTLTLDLSDSFDPDGDVITQYTIYGGLGLGPLISASPQFTVTLQPGCYNIFIAAKDAADTGYNSYSLKVYPQWESNTHVIHSPVTNQPGDFPRLEYLQMSRNPDTGLLTLAGYNGGQRMISIYQQDSGGSFTQHFLPTYSTIYASGEAVNAGKDFYMPLTNAASVLLLHWDATANGGAGEGELVPVSGGTVYGPDLPPFVSTSIALDADKNVWCFFADEDAGMINLMARNMSSLAAPVTVDDNITSLSALDSEFNAATGRIEIAASLPAGIVNYSFDPVSTLTDPPSTVIGILTGVLDLEINPSNDHPALVYQDTGLIKIMFSERDNLGVWSAPIMVDSSAINFFNPCCLEFTPAGQACNWMVVAPGQGGLYDTDLVTSVRRNAPADFAVSGTQMAMIHDSGDDFIIAGSDGNGRIMVKRLKADGSDQNLFTLDAVEGQGLQLCAAPEGASNIHAVWQTYNYGATHHYMSSDGGNTWAVLPDGPYPCNIELGSDSLGNLYAASADGLNDRLYYWDTVGSTFLNAGMDEPGSADTFPLLSNDPTSDRVAWLHANGVLTKNRETHGDPLGGFFSNDLPGSLFPLWGGSAVAVPGTIVLSYFYAFGVGGTTPSTGMCAWYDISYENFIFSPLVPAPNDVLTNPFVLDSSFAAAKFVHAGTIALFSGMENVFYTTNGLDMRPSRYIESNPTVTQNYAVDALSYTIEDIHRHNLLRTLSAFTAHGTTAVMVLANLDGEDQYMEWSNFGEFEELPMPAGIGRINRPQLVVTPDGRWHLIYHKPGTDVIFCRSTI